MATASHSRASRTCLWAICALLAMACAATAAQPRAAAFRHSEASPFARMAVPATRGVADDPRRAETSPTSAITLGGGAVNPTAVAVNPVTRRLYTLNAASRNVAVYDADTCARIATIPLYGIDYEESRIAVNPRTNRIYVTRSNIADTAVIDGNTNRLVGGLDFCFGSAVAVNPVANRVYVRWGNSVQVFNGDSGVRIGYASVAQFTQQVNGLTTVFPQFETLAVNTVTGDVFSPAGRQLSVIRGGNPQQVTTISVSAEILYFFATVDEQANRVYLLGQFGDLLALDATSLAVVGEAALELPTTGITADGARGAVYVAGFRSITETTVSDPALLQLDAATLEPRRTIDAGVGLFASTLCINPQTGVVYAVSDGDSLLTRVDTTGGSVIVEATPTARGILRMAVNPRTRRLFTANYFTDDVAVIDMATNSEVARVGVADGPRDLAVNATTNTVYVAGTSAGIQAIDGATLAVREIACGAGWKRMACDEANNRLYVAHGPSARVLVYNLATPAAAPTEIAVPGMYAMTAIAVDPQAGRLYVGGAGKTLLVVDIAGKRVVKTIALPYPVDTVAVNPAVKRVYAGGQGLGPLTAVATDTYQVLPSISTYTDHDLFTDIAVNTANNRVFLCNLVQEQIIAHTKDGLYIRPITVRVNPYSLAADPVANRVYVADLTDTVRMIDGATNTVIAGVTGDEQAGAACNSRTHRLYIANRGANMVTVVDTQTGGVITGIPVGQKPTSITVDEDLNRVYVTNAGDGSLSIINGATNTVMSTYPLQDGTGNRCNPRCIVRDAGLGRIFITNAQANTVEVYDDALHHLATIPVGDTPIGICVDTTTHRVYVANFHSATVTTIDARLLVTIGNPIAVDAGPIAVAADPQAKTVYVACCVGRTICRINAQTNRRVGATPLEIAPDSVTVNPASGTVYAGSSQMGAFTALAQATAEVLGVYTLQRQDAVRRVRTLALPFARGDAGRRAATLPEMLYTGMAFDASTGTTYLTQSATASLLMLTDSSTAGRKSIAVARQCPVPLAILGDTTAGAVLASLPAGSQLACVDHSAASGWRFAPAAAFDLAAGTGVFVYTPTATDYPVPLAPNPLGPHTTPTLAAAGWHLVANPWLTNIVWNPAKIRYRVGTGAAQPLANWYGTAGAPVAAYAWWWNPATQQYEVIGDPTVIPGARQTVPRGAAVWVKTSAPNVTLIFPPVYELMSTAPPAAAAQPRWRLPIAAATARGTQQVTIGLAPSRGVLVETPPPPPTFARNAPATRLIALTTTAPAMADYRTESARTETWRFTVQAGAGQAVRLAGWSGLIARVPTAYSVTLRDEATGHATDLRRTADYPFATGRTDAGRRFQVVVARR